MEPSGPTSGIPRTASDSVRVSTGQWQVGQLLQATVTDNRIGKVLLAIGNRQVVAETSLSLQKGQQLTLEVRSLGKRPVLGISSNASESVKAMAARLLLPRQGALTPLLANMNRLAQAANPPLPPLLNQLVRGVVKQMPGVADVVSPPQLRRAIENSGLFLEHRLQQAAQGGSRLSLDSDFKANLLRLVHLVRNWPGAGGSQPTAPAPQAATPGTTTPLPATPLPAAAQPSATATPEQIGRLVLSTVPGAGVSGTPPGIAATALPAAPLPGTAGLSTVAGLAVPPPLPGTVPVPQAAADVTLDLLNRLGNLRTDLLQQVDAALARTQLQQLASLPAEGSERTLVEWLLELPVRRGEEIDLWSLRIFRDNQDDARQSRESPDSWTVQLAFDLPGLGPVQAQVNLSGEQVSTRFWATHETTLPLLREHLHELRQALLDAGLEVGDLECVAGAAPAAAQRGEPLINEKA